MVKVALYMPSLNRPNLIIKAIDSIRNQTFSNWQLYILDCSSPQIQLGIKKTLESYMRRDLRIKAFFENKLIHQGIAYNKMIFELSQKNEKYVLFAADDIIMHPKKLEYLVNYLERNPEHQAICGMWVAKNGGTEAHGDFYSVDLAACVINLVQPMMRRSLIDRVGPMEQIVAGLCPDAVYWHQIARLKVKIYGARALGTHEELDFQYWRNYHWVEKHRKFWDTGGWERGENLE